MHKVEVAAATVSGMRDSGVDVLVTFPYDEDVFHRAVRESVPAHGLPRPSDLMQRGKKRKRSFNPAPRR